MHLSDIWFVTQTLKLTPAKHQIRINFVFVKWWQSKLRKIVPNVLLFLSNLPNQTPVSKVIKMLDALQLSFSCECLRPQRLKWADDVKSVCTFLIWSTSHWNNVRLTVHRNVLWSDPPSNPDTQSSVSADLLTLNQITKAQRAHTHTHTHTHTHLVQFTKLWGCILLQEKLQPT